METVQLQCGNCQKVMAIGVVHLGSQVQCPHCRSVVQTPAPSAPMDAPPAPPAPMATEPAPPIPDMELPQRESIFGEGDNSDAAIGESAAPQLQLPAAAPGAGETEPAAAAESPLAMMGPTADTAAELPTFQPRPVYDKGVMSMVALIFLVPYAILTTLFIIYLIFFGPNRADPLEFLRDPVPDKNKGGPQRVVRLQPKHDQPLAEQLRTKLGKPIQAGDLLVTPERVRLTAAGDLQLLLRARNVSTNTTFEPMNEAYVKHDLGKPTAKPFSFVESLSKSVDNVYGMYLGYHKDPQANDAPSGDAVLSPRGEVIIALTTYDRYREKHVPTMVKTNDRYLWRVRVRRGFVSVDGKDVSATAVIGVEFSTRDIEREKG